jgi:centractin
MTSGVVLDCGDGVCHSTAVFEGYSISNATNRIDIGGRDVT